MTITITFRTGVVIDAELVGGVAVFGTFATYRAHDDGRVTPIDDNLFLAGTWMPALDADERELARSFDGFATFSR